MIQKQLKPKTMLATSKRKPRNLKAKIKMKATKARIQQLVKEELEKYQEELAEKAIQETKGSTEGYMYEVVVRMVADRNRNKTEIVNDIRSIKDVTVVSVLPGQDFTLQKGAMKERTLIKIKFTPGSSPVKKMQQIKAAAFGRGSGAGCTHQKIVGLIELDFKRETLKPIRTY